MSLMDAILVPRHFESKVNTLFCLWKDKVCWPYFQFSYWSWRWKYYAHAKRNWMSDSNHTKRWSK